jgi:hypothetical protein
MPDSPQQRSHGYARSGAGCGRQCRWCITVVASCRTRSQFSCSSWCSKHSQLINNATHRDTDYTITTAAGEHPASSITGANSGGLSVTPRSPSAAGTRSSGADGRLEIHARREPLGASEPVTGELREPPRWVLSGGWGSCRPLSIKAAGPRTCFARAATMSALGRRRHSRHRRLGRV